MAGQMDMGQLLADQLVKAAKLVEEQLDVELNKFKVRQQAEAARGDLCPDCPY